MEVGRLQKEDTAKEEEKLRKAQARAKEPKRRPIRHPRKVLDRVVGGVGGVGRVGGVGDLLQQRYSPGIDHKLSLANPPAAVHYHRRF